MATAQAERPTLTLDLPDPEQDGTKRGVEMLATALRVVSDERARLERPEPKDRDERALAEVRTKASDLASRLATARRLYALRRHANYATNPAALDRVTHLEVCAGDVTRELVDAQVAADTGDWERAEERLKVAKARIADACNLAKLVAEGQLRSAAGGQMALPEVTDA